MTIFGIGGVFLFFLVHLPKSWCGGGHMRLKCGVFRKKSSFFDAAHLTFFLFAFDGCSCGGSKVVKLVDCWRL
jgi:hypothetical protein